MNNLINSVLNWFRNNPLVVSVLIGLAILLTGLLIFFYGETVTNHLASWWYSRGTDQAHEEINKALNEASENKQIAEEALKELALEKERTAAEKKKRELAESILADRSKNTDQKLKAYDEAVNRLPTVSEPTSSVDELCLRAKAAGIDCGN